MHRRVLFAVLTVLSVCGLVLPTVAVAATFTFEGTTFRSCWHDTEGFTAPPDLQPLPLQAGNPPGVHFLRFVTAAVSTTVIFNTDGTLTSTTTATDIRDTTTDRVGVTTNSCSGTWTFNAATQQVSTALTCDFTNTIGGNATGTFVVHATYSFAGITLVRVEPATPEVVTVNVLTGAGAPFSFQEVCGASQTLFFAK